MDEEYYDDDGGDSGPRPKHGKTANSGPAEPKKKRAQVARACTRCATGKRKCSGFPFPCERCVRLGLASTCVEVEVKGRHHDAKDSGGGGHSASAAPAASRTGPSSSASSSASASGPAAGKKRAAPSKLREGDEDDEMGDDGGGGGGGGGQMMFPYDGRYMQQGGFDSAGSNGPGRQSKVRRLLSHDDAATQSHAGAASGAVSSFAALSIDPTASMPARGGSKKQQFQYQQQQFFPMVSPDSAAAAVAVAAFGSGGRGVVTGQQQQPPPSPPGGAVGADGKPGSSGGLELLLRASGESSPANAASLVATLTEGIGSGGVAGGKQRAPAIGSGRAGGARRGVGGKTGVSSAGVIAAATGTADDDEEGDGGALFYGEEEEDDGEGEEEGEQDGNGFSGQYQPHAQSHQHHHRRHHRGGGTSNSLGGAGPVPGIAQGGGGAYHGRGAGAAMTERSAAARALYGGDDEDDDDGERDQHLPNEHDEEEDDGAYYHQHHHQGGMDDGAGDDALDFEGGIVFERPGQGAGLLRSPHLGPAAASASSSGRSPAFRAHKGHLHASPLFGAAATAPPGSNIKQRGGPGAGLSLGSPALSATTSAYAAQPSSGDRAGTMGGRKLTPLEAEARTLSDAYRDHLSQLAAATKAASASAAAATGGDDSHSPPGRVGGASSSAVGGSIANSKKQDKWPNQGHEEAKMPDLSAVDPFPCWRLTFADRYTGTSAADHAAATAPSQTILEAWLPGTSLRVGDRGNRVLFTGNPYRYEANTAGLQMFNLSAEDLLRLPFASFEDKRAMWAHPQDAPYRSAFCSKMQQEGNNSYQWRGRYLRRTCVYAPPPSLTQPASAAAPRQLQERWDVFVATELILVDYWPSGYVRFCLSTFSDIAVTGTSLSPLELAAVVEAAHGDAIKEKERADEEMRQKQHALSERLKAASAAAAAAASAAATAASKSGQPSRSPAFSLASPLTSAAAAAAAAASLQLPPPRLPRGSTGGSDGGSGSSSASSMSLSMGLHGNGNGNGSHNNSSTSTTTSGSGSNGNSLMLGMPMMTMPPARTDAMMLHRGSSGDFALMNAEFGAAAAQAIASSAGAGRSGGNQSTGGLSQNNSYGNLHSLSLGPPEPPAPTTMKTRNQRGGSGGGAGLLTSSNASSASSEAPPAPYLAPLGGAFAGLAMNMGAGAGGGGGGAAFGGSSTGSFSGLGRSFSDQQMNTLLGRQQQQQPQLGGSSLVSRPGSADMGVGLQLAPTTSGIVPPGGSEGVVGAGGGVGNASGAPAPAGRGSFSFLSFDAGAGPATARIDNRNSSANAEGGIAEKGGNEQQPQQQQRGGGVGSFDSRMSGGSVFELQALDAIISAPGFVAAPTAGSALQPAAASSAAATGVHLNPLVGATASAGPGQPSSSK